MKGYATEQRHQLLSFLKQHKDTQFSVDEIVAELNATVEISVSAVYRNINKMVQDGDIIRRALEGSRKFAYQYVGESECQNHLHMKCESCGKIIHIDSDVSNSLLDAAVKKNNFHINRKKTVLYGECDECVE